MASTAFSAFSAVDAQVFLIQPESAKEGRAPDIAAAHSDDHGPLLRRPSRARSFASLPRGLTRTPTPRPAELSAVWPVPGADAGAASSAVEELQVASRWFDDIAEGDEGAPVALVADGSPIWVVSPIVAAPIARGSEGAKATVPVPATAPAPMQARAQARTRAREQRRVAAARALAAIATAFAGVVAPGAGCRVQPAMWPVPPMLPAALLPL